MGMNREAADPHSGAVIDAAVDRIRSMTADEALGFLTQRSPDIEETDMTGMFAVPEKSARKRSAARPPRPVEQVVTR
jgi:hypothetical protein